MKNSPIEYTNETQQIAIFAKALAHPTRVHILKFLCCRDSCFTGDIVDMLPLAQSTVSQHLKELKTAGLILGTVDPPKIQYCINQENWKLAKKLLTDFFC